MKQLNPDGSITIPSNLPRTRQGPDSRGIRICFSELGRSCSLSQGFLIFTDGSAYAYDAPSNDIVEALCDQLQRGRVFNFQSRRSRGGFVRGFTPPADYETIYSFPPYAGTTPTACGVVTDWGSLVWSGFLAFSGLPASCSGVGLNVSQAYPGGLQNQTDVFTNSITIQADSPFVDCALHNTSGLPIDAQLYQLASGNNVAWSLLGSGVTQTLTLPLALVNSDFFMVVATNPQPDSGPISWDMVLTPHT